MDALSPVFMAVAPNGGRRTKADHPAIPLTTAELARTAAECAAAGAAMIHVHVRDRDGSHLLDAAAYRAAIDAIHREVGDALVVQITSEALGVYSPEEQIAVVREVRPRAVSLALRELAPDAAAEPAFGAFLDWLDRERVAPQVILYTPEEAIRLKRLLQDGVLPGDDIPVLYVLGRYTPGQTSVPSDLLPFLAPGMPRFGDWSVCAFGRHETACVTAAALLGGNVRVGFENNLWLPDGSLASSNADLARTVAGALSACGVPLLNGRELAGRIEQARG